MLLVGEDKFIQNLAVKPEGKITFGINWHRLEDNINLLQSTGHVMHQEFNLLKPTGHVMHQQFNIQQLYLCVLYLSENKQRLVPLTA